MICTNGLGFSLSHLCLFSKKSDTSHHLEAINQIRLSAKRPTIAGSLILSAQSAVFSAMLSDLSNPALPTALATSEAIRLIWQLEGILARNTYVLMT